ncbi:MAG: phosphoadenylyl-sulfate reductase [Oceanicaulis sp.]
MALDSARQIARSTLELPADTAPAEAFAAAAYADQIDVRFATFKDGRGFSLAALLRQNGYEGGLRAVGHLLPDQKDALLRSGFDRVQADDVSAPARWARNGAAHIYQPDPGAPKGRHTALHRRALAAREARAEALAQELKGADPETILARALEVYAGRIALLSSFGAEAALGLHLLAGADPETPVLFLETQRHFAQTLSYKDRLVSALGLKDVRVLEPDAEEAEHEDSDGKLYERDGEACCALRKVRPLARGLEDFDAVITGRKRYHGGARGALRAVEFDGERVKINPLAFLSPDEVAARFKALDLPSHPLRAAGYASIGCWPCTSPASEPGSRDGRWAGEDREECGIFDPALEARARRAGSIRLI